MLSYIRFLALPEVAAAAHLQEWCRWCLHISTHPRRDMARDFRNGAASARALMIQPTVHGT